VNETEGNTDETDAERALRFSVAIARKIDRSLERLADLVEAQHDATCELHLPESLERRLDSPGIVCNHERAAAVYFLPDGHQRMYAQYRHVETGRVTTLDVVAVNGDGDALVWTRQGLEVARTVGGMYAFDHVHEGDDGAVMAVAGGGWMAEHREDDGETWVEPVVAWVFDRFGAGTPVFTDSEGDARPESRGARIFHPDETSTRTPPA
jgi:hypothetical protein